MPVTSSKLPSWAKHLDFTIIDMVALAASFVVAYYLKFGDLSFVDSPQWRALFMMLLFADLVITLLTGPYSGVFRRSYWEDVGKSIIVALWGFLAACVVFYLFKIGEEYSREMLVTTFVMYVTLAVLLKAIHKKRMLSRRDRLPIDSVQRLVLATTRKNAREAEKLVNANDMKSAAVVGFCLVDSADDEEGEFLDRPCVSVAGVSQLSSRLNADELLVTVDPALLGADVYETLIEDGVRVSFAIVESLGVKAESQSVGRVGVLRTLDLERYSFGTGQLFYLPVKRVLDVFFGVIGCILTVPISAIVKISYLAVGDKHPIYYSQKRIGLRGKEFKLYKLRSMVWNADEVLEELLKDPARRAEWERDQKFEDDPRITGMGRFLRRTSLDELPQFLNVIKGEMSVVGPRPLVPGELEKHGGRSLYTKMKPGITGWWGCNGRSNIGYRERLELEYHYIKHCSLYLDVLCVFRTMVAIVKKDGAQ